MGRPGTSHEITTSGFDKNLQGVGGDPYGSSYQLGIQIPVAPPASGNRFLFMLCLSRIGANEKARLVGMRQLATIRALISGEGTGDNATLYPLEIEVTSPFWHFTDANISWHLKKVAPLKRNTNNVFNSEGMQFLYAQTPALIYQRAPTDAGGYLAPYGGIPPGNNVIADLSNFHDLRFPWTSQQALGGLNIEFEGPCDIALFASVKQSNPQTRAKLPTGLNPLFLPDEDRFVYNFATAVYGRIAGSLIFERQNQYPEPRSLVEKLPPFRRAE